MVGPVHDNLWSPVRRDLSPASNQLFLGAFRTSMSSGDFFFSGGLFWVLIFSVGCVFFLVLFLFFWIIFGLDFFFQLSDFYVIFGFDFIFFLSWIIFGFDFSSCWVIFGFDFSFLLVHFWV